MVSSAAINAINSIPGIASLIPFAALVPEGLVGASALVFLMGGVFAADKRADRIYLWLGLLMLAALFAIMVFLPVSASQTEMAGSPA